MAKSLALELHYGLGLSFEKVSRLLARFGIMITRGALARAALTTGRALAPTHEAIKNAVVATRNVTMDETGWRIRRERRLALGCDEQGRHRLRGHPPSRL